MRILAGVIITAALATTAEASPARLDDVAYMQAARCAGLASSSKLGSADAAAALKAMVKNQSGGRDFYIQDKADDLQRDAKREADRADDVRKAKLTAELNGACAALKG